MEELKKGTSGMYHANSAAMMDLEEKGVREENMH